MLVSAISAVGGMVIPVVQNNLTGMQYAKTERPITISPAYQLIRGFQQKYLIKWTKFSIYRSYDLPTAMQPLIVCTKVVEYSVNNLIVCWVL